MAQPFLHAGQNRPVVPGLDMDHPVGRQAGLLETGGEEILLRDAPEHPTLRPRGNTGNETGSRCAIHRAVAAAGNLMQATERQPAARQLPVQLRNAEREHLPAARPVAFQQRDAPAESRNGWGVGALLHGKGGSGGFPGAGLADMFLICSHSNQESIGARQDVNRSQRRGSGL